MGNISKNKYDFITDLLENKKLNFTQKERILMLANKELKKDFSSKKKIEERVQNMEDTDTTEITSLLENMKAKLNNAKAQSNAITAAVSPLESTNFPANRVTLQSAQAKLKTGMTDIRSAVKDLKEILKMLKEMGETTALTPTISE